MSTRVLWLLVPRIGQPGCLHIRPDCWRFWRRSVRIFRWVYGLGLLERCQRLLLLGWRNHEHIVSIFPLSRCVEGRWRSQVSIGLWSGRAVHSGCWIYIALWPKTTFVPLDRISGGSFECKSMFWRQFGCSESRDEAFLTHLLKTRLIFPPSDIWFPGLLNYTRYWILANSWTKAALIVWLVAVIYTSSGRPMSSLRRIDENVRVVLRFWKMRTHLGSKRTSWIFLGVGWWIEFDPLTLVRI